jgi:hypothetical protein
MSSLAALAAFLDDALTRRENYRAKQRKMKQEKPPHTNL